MKKDYNSVLKEALERITPSKEDFEKMNCVIDEFKNKVGKRIKELNVGAEIFIGGSFAKKTMIKKDKYDIDIFIRFDKKHRDISELTKKLLGDFKIEEIRGSRDYFIIDRGDFFIEVIPVMKVSNPRNAENVTDLSYSHVNYIRKKLKGKILNEIRIAKAFCYANGCYGAESYIKGFSGYSIELLVYNYGGFIKFIKAFEKINEKAVVDIEKHFKKKGEVFMDLNEAKLHSPIILIDPTYKKRNALAALSYDTFGKFKNACGEFLKKPSIKFFEARQIDLEKIKSHAKRKKFEFVLIHTETNRQSGDIAGGKLLKFHNFLTSEIDKSFQVKSRGFEYKNGKKARAFFVVKKKEELTSVGPRIEDKENVAQFRKKHKNIFMKAGRVYAKEKINLDLKEFLENWKKKNKERMREMSVDGMEIINYSSRVSNPA